MICITGAAIVRSTMSKQDLRYILEEIYEEDIPVVLKQSLELDKAQDQVEVDLMLSIHKRSGISRTG